MAQSNFRVFAESVDAKNIESDNEYETDTQRVSGVVPGIANPDMHNKLYKQATIMAAALAQVIVQAGMDALDSDYTGLVSNLRKSFAGSVNGIKPDEIGNIDITDLLENIRKLTYPRIGDFIITKNPENPSKKYDGTTWQLLEEKTFIMSAGGMVPVGATGGNNSHTLTVNEMPAHTHSVTMGAAGGHNHTRGSMNIIGTFGVHSHDTEGDNWQGGSRVSGAFYAYKTWCSRPTSGKDSNLGAVINFNASRNWSGSTSYAAAHTHSLSISTTGAGNAWDTRPKYIAAYIWIRTA